YAPFLFSFFFLSSSSSLIVLHSFPTRRSSDLYIRTIDTSSRHLDQYFFFSQLWYLSFFHLKNRSRSIFLDYNRIHTYYLNTIALDRKSTRLNSSHVSISYAVFCLKKKK